MYQAQQTESEKYQMQNTISDFDKEEQKRKFSISTCLIRLSGKRQKINVLDTPDISDFVGEVEEAVSAADAAVIVVSGKAGAGGYGKHGNCAKNTIFRV